MTQKLQNDPPAIKVPPPGSRKHEDALLDEAVAETMIASDPISPAAQALMEPVNPTPAAERARTRRTRDSSMWIFVVATAAALVALRALRRSPRP